MNRSVPQRVELLGHDSQVLTRDSYSSSPIYFLEQPRRTASGNQWIVSTRLREIGARVNFQPSPEGIRDFLCYGFVPAPRTIFKGVSAIPPGLSCYLPLWGEELTWYSAAMNSSHPIKAPELLFWQYLCEHSQLEESAVLLSGGLDSAMVSAAAQISGSKLTTYHARFRGADMSPGSDTHAARITAAYLGLAYQEVLIDSVDALRYFTKVIAALDQPLGDPVVLPFYLLFKHIRLQQPHVKVLTGEGGDQLFGSWSMKPMLMRELYHEANYTPAGGYLATFHKFHAEWPDLLSRSMLQKLDIKSDLTSPLQHAMATSPSSDFCSQIRWVDLHLKGLQHIVPRITAMANAQQLSLQHPFFNPKMIELGMALPNALKFSGSQDKVLLKQLAGNHLPPEVIYRRKQGMGVPTSLWFRGGLKPLAAYYLNTRRIRQSGLLNPDTVQAIRQQQLTASDRQGRRWGDRLWMLCVLESWFASLTKN